MHFSPRQADVIAAICKLQESGQREDITYDRLQKETGIGHVPRILAGIKDREKILIRETHRGKTTLALNRNNIVTTGLVARILIELHWATRSDHVWRDQFKKKIIESVFFQKARASKNGKEDDNDYLDIILNWCLLPDAGYTYVAHESPDRIGASDRVLEEMDYLERIAVSLE